MTKPQFTAGTTVRFRDDFSAKLREIEFVIDVPAKQDATGRLFVGIHVKDAPKKIRLAYIADLVVMS
jgi:hypothetical protein